MKLESVKDADTVTGVQDARYWRGEHWAIYMGPQFSKELDGQLVLAVLEDKTWRTVYPYFRLENGAKNLAEALVAFIMKKLVPIRDHEVARSTVESLVRGLGHLFGEVKEDYYKNCGDQATYCQVDTTKVRESLDPIIEDKKNGKTAAV